MESRLSRERTAERVAKKAAASRSRLDEAVERRDVEALTHAEAMQLLLDGATAESTELPN